MIRPRVLELRVRGRDDERTAAQVDGGDVAADDLGAEALRLGAHLGHQIRAHDAVPMSGPVLDERGEHQLPAGLEPLDEQGLQVRPRGVQRRRSGPPGLSR